MQDILEFPRKRRLADTVSVDGYSGKGRTSPDITDINYPGILNNCDYPLSKPEYSLLTVRGILNLLSRDSFVSLRLVSA